MVDHAGRSSCFWGTKKRRFQQPCMGIWFDLTMINLLGRSNPMPMAMPMAMATSSQAFAFCSRLLYAFELKSYKQDLFCHQSIRFSSRSTFHSNCAIFRFFRQSRDYGEAPDWPRTSNHFRRQKTCSRRVADNGVPAYPSRHDTTCRRRFVPDKLSLLSNMFDMPRRDKNWIKTVFNESVGDSKSCHRPVAS